MLDSGLAESLRQLYGDIIGRFVGRHHARRHAADVPYHVISRIYQGRHLLRPCDKLNQIINGVIARAKQLCPNVRLYADAFLSNHLHMMLQGPADQIPRFMGFIKREISRRWGKEIDWSGTMWDEYVSTALPTEDSQLACLEYILSQGVKEGLVATPQEWPGVHCARHLADGEKREGIWFDGSSYSKAKFNERRKPQQRQQAIDKASFTKKCELTLDPIPVWRNLSESERRDATRAIIACIIESAAAARGGHPPLGAAAVLSTPLERKTEIPRPPWFEGRKRMVCWSSPAAPETRAYIEAYWEFQVAFREASDRYRAGDRTVHFPEGAFVPMLANTASSAAASSSSLPRDSHEAIYADSPGGTVTS